MPTEPREIKVTWLQNEWDIRTRKGKRESKKICCKLFNRVCYHWKRRCALWDWRQGWWESLSNQHGQNKLIDSLIHHSLHLRNSSHVTSWTFSQYSQIKIKLIDPLLSIKLKSILKFLEPQNSWQINLNLRNILETFNDSSIFFP